MFTIYCQDCGFKNENSQSKPKFCSGCGKSFSNDNTPKESLSKAENRPKRRLASDIRNSKPHHKEDEYDDDAESAKIDIDSITEFPVQIEGFSVGKRTRRRTLGDVIVPESESKAPTPIPKVKISRNHNKKSMAEFKKEAGTNRKK